MESQEKIILDLWVFWDLSLGRQAPWHGDKQKKHLQRFFPGCRFGICSLRSEDMLYIIKLYIYMYYRDMAI